MPREQTGGYDEYSAFLQYRATGSRSIRDEIIKHNLYIAQILSKKFTGRGIEYDDIYQVACLGLLYAAERYDPNMNVKFASYATPTVMGEIKKYFRDKGYYIRVPRRLYEIFKKAERIRRSSAGEIDSVELAERLKIPKELLEQAEEAGNTAFIRSLEEFTDSDGDITVAELIGREDKSFIMVENRDFADYCFSRLSERESEFVKLRYFDEKSQKEIARQWQVSQMYVSRLERRVLEKLKQMYFRD